MTYSVENALEQLDLHPRTHERLGEVLARRRGLVLITGTRGSGRTTTFLTCLSHLAQRGTRVMLVAPKANCPVEGVLVQTVEAGTDSAYCTALRLALGRSPDAVAMADLGGVQVAQFALEAATMNHLVLGRWRSGTAAEAVASLLAMGIDSCLIRDGLSAVLAQRLVRRVCPQCRKPYRPTEEETDSLGVPPSWRESSDLQFFRAIGCPACEGSGYAGLCALFQLLVCDESVVEHVASGTNPGSVEASAARRQGLRTLMEEGLVRCVQGLTTPEEILRPSDAG